MKKSRYYPFERNRYFYGKLLTVRDFESEQKYVNDKRRLLNRLIHGGGVIAGMQVIAVDDKSISVEMGAALDYQGREIVIPSPVLMKLSMIDGFTNNEYAKNVYLYVAYDEKGKEPVHSIANSAVRNEEVSEHNRILESYRLYIREKAPDPASFELAPLFESVSVIYQDQHVRIYQRAPKYVNPEDTFEIELVVEKTLQTQPISLEYDLQSEWFTPVNSDYGMRVSFTEPIGGHETEYTLKTYLKATNNPGQKGVLAIDRESVKLSIGDKKIVLDTNPANEIRIISEAVGDKILSDYYERTLDQSLEGSSEEGICLAKINLLQMGPTYMIEQVEKVPFGEYIYNLSLLNRLNQADQRTTKQPFFVSSTYEPLKVDEQPRFTVDYNQEQSRFNFTLGLPQNKVLHDEMTSGRITIQLEKNQKSAFSFFLRGEKSYVTDEIEHGLGQGNVYINVGLEEGDGFLGGLLETSERIFYGSTDVFKDSQFESQMPEISFGTVVYPKAGTFRIGMKLHGTTEAESITLRWWAFRNMKEGVGTTQLEQAFLQAAPSNKEQ